MSEKKSPLKLDPILGGVMAVTAIGGLIGMSQAAKTRRQANELSAQALAEQKRQNRLLEKQKREYKSMQFKNPYEGLENFYEDLTINQQQAQFETMQMQQQQANIMTQFRQAAGGSGIAGLAQAMANQGQLGAQRIGAGIGAQESRLQAMRAQGAQQAEMARRGGAQWIQQAEMDRQATLLGMQMGQAAGANQALQQSQANAINAQIAQQQITADMFSNVAGLAAMGAGKG